MIPGGDEVEDELQAGHWMDIWHERATGSDRVICDRREENTYSRFKRRWLGRCSAGSERRDLQTLHRTECSSDHKDPEKRTQINHHNV